MKITVNPQKCPQNHRCPSIAVCPKGAISQKDIYSLPEIDGEKCIQNKNKVPLLLLRKILYIQKPCLTLPARHGF